MTPQNALVQEGAEEVLSADRLWLSYLAQDVRDDSISAEDFLDLGLRTIERVCPYTVTGF